jgi:hypothetical protein
VSVPDSQPLSDHYHKAHKQVTLCAALLLCWEFVGVDLNQAKSAGGNIGAIVGSLKSPQAVPWVLVILVLYFLFKFNVEWHQCNEARRKLTAALFDFWAAWIIACTALLLFCVQTLSQVQFADSLNSRRVLALVTALVFSLVTLKAFNHHHAHRYRQTLVHFVVALATGSAAVPFSAYNFWITVVITLVALTTFLLALGRAVTGVRRLFYLATVMLKRIRRKAA